DHKSKPKPHVITGKGMEMELATTAEPARPGARKLQKDSISGVKWIVLQSAVRMELYTSGGSFLAGTAETKETAKPAEKQSANAGKPEQQARLTITTPGKFRYDILKDHDEARFDALEVAANQTSRLPPQVACDRENLQTHKHDQLTC